MFMIDRATSQIADYSRVVIRRRGDDLRHIWGSHSRDLVALADAVLDPSVDFLFNPRNSLAIEAHRFGERPYGHPIID